MQAASCGAGNGKRVHLSGVTSLLGRAKVSGVLNNYGVIHQMFVKRRRSNRYLYVSEVRDRGASDRAKLLRDVL